MVSPRVSAERQSESFADERTSVSFVGGSTVPHPEPSKARARTVRVGREGLHVELTDGRSVTVPLKWFPRLIEASPREQRNYELLGGGVVIRWPAVDEDISVASLLRG